MSTQNGQKLKSVLDAVPPGYLVTAAWLSDRGIAYETFRDYVKRGWLERVVRGVFRRPTPMEAKAGSIDWQTCILSLQHILKLKIHVGGMTALGLHGYRHSLPFGEEPVVWVYGDRIPNWLSSLPMNARITTRSLSLFQEAARGVGESMEMTTPIVRPQTAHNGTLITSSAERAILEALNEVPDHESFENVDKTFEALARLRPRAVAELLRLCKRIKAKRLFFVLADRHLHAWRQYVDPDDFDLGRGDRALVPGGSLHPRYRIVVPKEYLPAKGSDSLDD